MLSSRRLQHPGVRGLNPYLKYCKNAFTSPPWHEERTGLKGFARSVPRRPFAGLQRSHANSSPSGIPGSCHVAPPPPTLVAVLGCHRPSATAGSVAMLPEQHFPGGIAADTSSASPSCRRACRRAQGGPCHLSRLRGDRREEPRSVSSAHQYCVL